jgi:hypothetical protein
MNVKIIEIVLTDKTKGGPGLDPGKIVTKDIGRGATATREAKSTITIGLKGGGPTLQAVAKELQEAKAMIKTGVVQAHLGYLPLQVAARPLSN